MKETYDSIFWATVKEFDLSPVEVLLTALIFGLSKKRGYCFASKDYLAKIINVSDGTVFNNLRKLKEKGLIREGVSNDEYGTKGIQLTEKWHLFVKSKYEKVYDKIYK